MIDFQQYLSALPLLHTWDEGKTWVAGGFKRKHLGPLIRFLKKNLPTSPAILETGAGNSTISFLFLKPGRLVSIDPALGLHERIRAYCETHGISTKGLEPLTDRSEWTLPILASNMRAGAGEFDFALIDGCHNWPSVFVDFYYSNYMLKQGGYIMLDDLQLHSVKELARLSPIRATGFRACLGFG
jgi:predicted O-methyltransferase YrrM